jgi:6-pyruvoyltetrahydropterin/6-carboxytetrahydropterin synthase
MEEYSIEFTEYFKFNSSHFVLYKGFREPLHGHNYKVSLKLTSANLNEVGVILNSDNLIEIMNNICKNLKHKLLLPANNSCLEIKEVEKNYELLCEDRSSFSIPKSDVKILNIDQISAECLAKFIALELLAVLKLQLEESLKKIQLKKLQIKVSEDRGKKGVYSLKFN